MEYIAITVIAVAGIYFVVYPLLSRNRADFDELFALGDTRQLNYLNSKKTLIFENIKELEFEYEMGKLSEEDYASLRQGYLREAEEVTKEIDELKVRAEIQELIEEDVRTRRRIQDS